MTDILVSNNSSNNSNNNDVKCKNENDDSDLDLYMRLCNVKDSIVPIFLNENIDEYDPKFKNVNDYLEYCDDKLDSTSASSQFDEPNLVPITVDDNEAEDLEERGCFDEQFLQFLSLDPENVNNSVTILGQAITGHSIKCVDHSCLKEKFPIYSYEWYISSEFGISDKYDPEVLSKTDTLQIDNSMIGKFIACRAHRIIEKQISFQDDYKTRTNVYDPHVITDLVQLNNFSKQKHVISMATIGPVLISDQWALVILEKLVESEFRLDIQFHIRDDILALCGEFRYKHLYMSEIEWIDAQLSVNYKNLVISFPNSEISERMKEVLDVFGIGDSIAINIGSAVLNKDQHATLLVENTSFKINQPYIIEIRVVKPKEYNELIYYICGCYQTSSMYKTADDEWRNYLSQGNLNIVKHLLNKFLSS